MKYGRVGIQSTSQKANKYPEKKQMKSKENPDWWNSTRAYSSWSGMWITADFRLYPPVITANQELVSPTGDHRYRGGTERAHPRRFRV